MNAWGNRKVARLSACLLWLPAAWREFYAGISGKACGNVSVITGYRMRDGTWRMTALSLDNNHGRDWSHCRRQNSTFVYTTDKPLSLRATQTQEAKPPCGFATRTPRKPGFLRLGHKKCAHIIEKKNFQKNGLFLRFFAVRIKQNRYSTPYIGYGVNSL
jgi:hypothetical protein